MLSLLAFWDGKKKKFSIFFVDVFLILIEETMKILIEFYDDLWWKFPHSTIHLLSKFPQQTSEENDISTFFFLAIFSRFQNIQNNNVWFFFPLIAISNDILSLQSLSLSRLIHSTESVVVVAIVGELSVQQ